MTSDQLVSFVTWSLSVNLKDCTSKLNVVGLEGWILTVRSFTHLGEQQQQRKDITNGIKDDSA